MDIAKYIGLFLLKNNFCYIHGLGNLELKKKPAAYDGEALLPPSYEVQLTPGGSIDDNLANFIATAEQISISKAANALRDFSTESKAALQEGKEVAIPSLGKFVKEDDVVTFITDPNMQVTPPGILVGKNNPGKPADVALAAESKSQPKTAPVAEPARKNPVEEAKPQPKQEQQPVAAPATATPKSQPVQTELPPANYPLYPDYPEEKRGINWGRTLLILGIVGVVVAGAIWGIQYMNKQEAAPAIILPQDTMPAEQPIAVPAPTTADSAITSVDSTTAAAAPAATATAPASVAGQKAYQLVVNTYGMDVKAQERVTKLKSFGNNASVARSSKGYHVIVNVMARPEDTSYVADSLRKLYNPSGKVYVYYPEQE